MLLQKYRLSVDSVIARFLADLVRLLLVGYDPSDRAGSLGRLSGPLVDMTRQARAESYAAGADLLVGLAAQAGVSDPYVPKQSGYPDSAVVTVLRDELRGPAGEAADRVGRRLAQHVEDSGRQTLIRSVEDGRPADSPVARRRKPVDALDDLPEDQRGAAQPKAWARVLSGAENCAFCVVLASRGPVYASADDAGLPDDPDGPDINRYHPNCDCLIVPVYDYGDWPGRDDWKALERLYKRATENPIWNGARIGKDVPRSEWPGSAQNDLLGAVERELRYMSSQGDSLPVTDVRTGAPPLLAA